MDCAGFESELVELMDGGYASNAQERDLRLRALRAHAADCDACASGEDLLQLLELPRGQRDLANDPGQAYWDSFDRRVRERIRRESTRTQPTRLWWIAAAAAAPAVLLFLVGTCTFRRGAAESNTTTIAGSETTAGPGPATAPSAELPEELARMVEAAPYDVLVQLEDLAGWGSSWDAAAGDLPDDSESWGAGGGLFPDVSGLDGDASQAFLLWLREQTS